MSDVENIRVLGFFQKFPTNGREPEDWVIFGPATDIQKTQTRCRVKEFLPKEGQEMRGLKKTILDARWAIVGPKYEAWKKGLEIPEDGTALGAWPGITKEQAEAMKRHGIRTVEDVARMTDSQIGRVPIPGVRELKKQASMFLENREQSATAGRITELEMQIAAMSELLDQKQAKESSDQQDANDEVATLRAELDALGISYDKRFGADKLRTLLLEHSEAA